VSNAVAIGKPGVCVATIAQDYAFGRDGVAAFKEALQEQGGKVVHEEYLPMDATDFTAAGQRLLDVLKDRSDCGAGKFIFGIWAGPITPSAASRTCSLSVTGSSWLRGATSSPHWSATRLSR